jgi:hypothetical protein
MANEVRLVDDLPCVAKEDLSEQQYAWVKVADADWGVKRCSATDAAIGLLQNKPKDGQAAAVRAYGVSRAKLGGVVNRGDRVGPNDASLTVAKTTDGAVVGGIALSGGVTSEFCSVLLIPASKISVP